MRGGILLALLVSILTASVCQAGSPGDRQEATAIMEKLRTTTPPEILAEEFKSIAETFARAEKLEKEGKSDEARKLYQLTMLKSAVYEKKMQAMAATMPSTGGTVQGSAGHPATAETAPAGPPERIPPETAHPAMDQADDSRDMPGAEPDDDQSAAGPIASKLIIGRKFVYTVKRRESLRMLGARLGVNWRSIARDNVLDPAKVLEPGQQLTIDTRRIIPKTRAEGIVINIPDRTMYLFRNKKLESAVPVGLGMPTMERDAVWRTPTGSFRIVSKVQDPTWFIPQSILKKMRKTQKDVKNTVPPGKQNPLGKYALKTSLTGILIHGTSAPESIYAYRSHGCIRVMPGTMKEIFDKISINTGGEIIYEPVKLALSDDGRIFLEVHGDAYNQFDDLEHVARSLLEQNNLEQMVDWERVRSSIRKKKGVPVDVTLRDETHAVQARNSGSGDKLPQP
jgi:L,D-transpeptidase ErfK/SrfK